MLVPFRRLEQVLDRHLGEQSPRIPLNLALGRKDRPRVSEPHLLVEQNVVEDENLRRKGHGRGEVGFGVLFLDWQ